MAAELDLSKVTIIVTSFLRPGYLKDCLEGIAKNLPECKVIVVDDGGLTGDNIISLPFDSGLSAKRNAGVAATKTEYILMGSDDFDFSTRKARIGIERFLHVLETTDADLAGGNVDNNIYEGNLIVVPGQYIAQVPVKHSPSGVTPCDLTVNYFLVRTDSIRDIPWDARMKIGGEHGDWFLSMKDAGRKVVAVTGVSIDTYPLDISKQDQRYAGFRGRAKNLGHKIFMHKRGVSNFYGATDTPPAPLQLPRYLVAVVACHKNQDKINELRSTWLPSLYKIDYKVFYGRGASRKPLADEVFLNVDDGYYGLPAKMKAIYQWALNQGYEYIFKVDDDVYVNVERLIPCGWDKHDYSGRINRGGTIPWASGACYWLSKKSMQIIANAPLTSDTAEDRWVGTTLHNHGIKLHDEPRYGLVVYMNRPPAWETDITACICTKGITVTDLEKGFENNQSPLFTAPPVPYRSPHAPVQNLPAQVRPIPAPNWEKSFLETKVQNLFKKFRYVVATIPKSAHYKQLCRIYPDHLEEVVETPEGRRIIFVVEK